MKIFKNKDFSRFVTPDQKNVFFRVTLRKPELKKIQN